MPWYADDITTGDGDAGYLHFVGSIRHSKLDCLHSVDGCRQIIACRSWRSKEASGISNHVSEHPILTLSSNQDAWTGPISKAYGHLEKHEASHMFMQDGKEMRNDEK